MLSFFPCAASRFSHLHAPTPNRGRPKAPLARACALGSMAVTTTTVSDNNRDVDVWADEIQLDLLKNAYCSIPELLPCKSEIFVGIVSGGVCEF